MRQKRRLLFAAWRRSSSAGLSRTKSRLACIETCVCVCDRCVVTKWNGDFEPAVAEAAQDFDHVIKVLSSFCFRCLSYGLVSCLSGCVLPFVYVDIVLFALFVFGWERDDPSQRENLSLAFIKTSIFIEKYNRVGTIIRCYMNIKHNGILQHKSQIFVYNQDEFCLISANFSVNFCKLFWLSNFRVCGP